MSKSNKQTTPEFRINLGDQVDKDVLGLLIGDIGAFAHNAMYRRFGRAVSAQVNSGFKAEGSERPFVLDGTYAELAFLAVSCYVYDARSGETELENPALTLRAMELLESRERVSVNA